jgi:hypothetical protein
MEGPLSTRSNMVGRQDCLRYVLPASGFADRIVFATFF